MLLIRKFQIFVQVGYYNFRKPLIEATLENPQEIYFVCFSSSPGVVHDFKTYGEFFFMVKKFIFNYFKHYNFILYKWDNANPWRVN
jgi:hypothetical protein